MWYVCLQGTTKGSYEVERKDKEALSNFTQNSPEYRSSNRMILKTSRQEGSGLSMTA